MSRSDSFHLPGTDDKQSAAGPFGSGAGIAISINSCWQSLHWKVRSRLEGKFSNKACASSTLSTQVVCRSWWAAARNAFALARRGKERAFSERSPGGRWGQACRFGCSTGPAHPRVESYHQPQRRRSRWPDREVAVCARRQTATFGAPVPPSIRSAGGMEKKPHRLPISTGKGQFRGMSGLASPSTGGGLRSGRVDGPAVIRGEEDVPRANPRPSAGTLVWEGQLLLSSDVAEERRIRRALRRRDLRATNFLGGEHTPSRSIGVFGGWRSAAEFRGEFGERFRRCTDADFAIGGGAGAKIRERIPRDTNLLPSNRDGRKGRKTPRPFGGTSSDRVGPAFCAYLRETSRRWAFSLCSGSIGRSPFNPWRNTRIVRRPGCLR